MSTESLHSISDGNRCRWKPSIGPSSGSPPEEREEGLYKWECVWGCINIMTEEPKETADLSLCEHMDPGPTVREAAWYLGPLHV